MAYFEFRATQAPAIGRATGTHEEHSVAKGEARFVDPRAEASDALQRSELLPSFVISLDVELRWGLHDRLGLDFDAYRGNLEGERESVCLLLRAFAERSLRATWATVGALACRDWDEYFERAPRPPRYGNPALAINPQYAKLDPDGHLHFAPELVREILQTPNQELGTHTFSHLLVREPGVTAADVDADLSAVATLWRERFGASPRSLVFPRNQAAFLSVVRGCGIRIWRGNPLPWYYESNERSTNGPRARALRLLDDLNPRVRHACPLEGDMTRATLFLRLDLPRPAWRLHLLRIRFELETLRAGEIFHLWWHPHNLGAEPRRSLDRVCEVLDLVTERIDRGLLASRAMGELVP